MTVRAILSHAAAPPSVPAIIRNGQALGYPALARNVAQFAQALRESGLAPGNAAAVECVDPCLHLLLLLACEWLGVGTVSLIASDLPSKPSLLGHMDLVLTERPADVRGARRILAVDQTWVRRALALSGNAGAPAPVVAADLFRLVRTSGTTGMPKYAWLRRDAHEGRVAAWLGLHAFAPGHRYLVATPFSFNAVYVDAFAALRAGASLVFELRVALAQALAEHAITHVKLLPLRIRDTADRLPSDYAKRADLTVTSTGGPLAPALRRRTEARLAGRVRNVYGSNETGGVSIVEADNPTGIGTLLPGVELEIVAESGAPVPSGATGRVRMRTPYMVEDYLDDPAASAAMFRDGWFYPGDLGVLRGERRFELVSRADELMVVGGLKVLPAELEEKVVSRTDVSDAGACTIRNAEGVEEVWIAVVYDAPDDRDIRQRLMPAFRDYPYGAVHLVKLARIPRTDTGKIRRAALKEAMIAASPRDPAAPLAAAAAAGEAGGTGSRR